MNSYNIVFLPLSAQDDWAGAMDNLEMHAMMGAEPSTADILTWDRLSNALAENHVPFQRTDGDEERIYDLLHPAMRITLRPGDIRIAVPYDVSAVGEITEGLPNIVHLTEEVAGKVAYDPQADQPFFAPENHPTDVIQSVCRRLAEHEAAASLRSERRGVFRRFFGRRTP